MEFLRILVLVAAVVGAFGCTDNTPDKELQCPELIGGLGAKLCSESWFLDGNYCMRSCGRSPCPAKQLNLQQGSVTLVGKRTGEQKDNSAPAASVELSASAPVAPVEQPQQAPVEQPEQAPVEQPEQAPVEQPEQAPVEQPEQAPVEQPEQAPVEQPEEVSEVPQQSSKAECQDVASFLAGRGELSFLKSAMDKTSLASSLSGFSGTIFAPSNSAFDKLLGLLELSKDQFFSGNAQVIEQLLKIHVVPGDKVSPGASREVSSLLGGAQKLKIGGGSVTSPTGATAKISETIDVCSAVVIIIDSVIIPKPVEGVTSG